MDGRQPVSNDIVKIFASGRLISEAIFLRNNGVSLSGPAARLFFCFFS
jgi:hypothetical protein